MKNGVTYFKYGALVISLLIIWFILRDLGCGMGNGGSKTTTDTLTIIRDTTYHQVDTFVSYVPKPYKVIEHDTLEIDGEPIVKWKEIPTTVLNVYKDYHSKKYYNDSFNVKYGTLYLYDTVRGNSIVGKGFSLKQSIPEITNTIVVEKPRVKGFLGVEVMGNRNTPIAYTGVSFSLLMKTNQMYSVKGGLLSGGNYMVGIEMKRLITFRKRGR